MAVIESINTASAVSGNIQYLMDETKKDRTISDVYDAVSGNNETLYQRTVKIDTKMDSLVSAVTSGNLHLANIDAALSMGSISGIDQAALLSVEISTNGDAKDFMHSLTKLAELDDVNLIAVSNGLDSIGDSLDKILAKDFNKVQPMLSGLEAMTVGLTKFTSSLPSFKQLGGIAAGIALMGLSIVGVVSAVAFDDILKMGLIFGGVALASKLLEGTSTNLLKASFGVATMGLSIWAFNELVDGVALTEFATSLLTIGLATLVFDSAFGKAAARTGTSLISLAVGVGVLGVALLPYEMVEWESIGKAAATLGGIGIASHFVKNIESKSVLGLLGLAGAVGVMGLSLQLFDNISYNDVGVALLALGGITGIAFLLGKVGKNALIGALTLAGIGASMGVLAWGLDKIRSLDLTLEDAGVIATTIGLTAAAFAALGIPAVAALVGLGAVAALGMGAALAALSYGLNSIATVNLTEADAQNFANSMYLVKDVFVNLGDSGGIIALGLGMAQAALITGATLPLVLAMNLLSGMSTPTEATMLGFDRTVASLKDTFTQFGVLDLVELAAVTPVMLLLATTTVALGGAINLFTKLSTDTNSVDGAIGTLDAFLVGLHTTFAKHDDAAFDVLSKGIDATMGIGKLLRNLALGISKISVEMEKNTDFHAIGVSVGSMLQALTEPLAAIGGQNDEISIGGFKITNPFSNKVEDGINALKNIGGVFTPIAEMIKVFAEDTDGKIVDKFKTNITGILGSLGDIFSTYSMQENSMDIASLVMATDKTSKFISALGGVDYDKASKGLGSISGSVASVKDSINGTDLERLTKLNDLFYNMNQFNESEGLAAILEALRDLVEEMSKSMETKGNETNNQTTINNTTDSDNKKTTKDVTEKQINDDLAQIITQGNGDVVQEINKLTSYLKSGSLRVVQKQNNF